MALFFSMMWQLMLRLFSYYSGAYCFQLHTVVVNVRCENSPHSVTNLTTYLVTFVTHNFVRMSLLVSSWVNAWKRLVICWSKPAANKCSAQHPRSSHRLTYTHNRWKLRTAFQHFKKSSESKKFELMFTCFYVNILVQKNDICFMWICKDLNVLDRD